MKRNLKGKKKTLIMGGTVYVDDILNLRKFSCDDGSYGITLTYLSEFHCLEYNPVCNYYRYFDTEKKRNNVYDKIMNIIEKNMKIKKPFEPMLLKNDFKCEKVIDGWVFYKNCSSKFVYDPEYKITIT